MRLNGMAYHLLARQGQEAQGDLAELGYRQALQFDPNAWWAAYGLGMLHVERETYAQAQDDFGAIILPQFLQGFGMPFFFIPLNKSRSGR